MKNYTKDFSRFNINEGTGIPFGINDDQVSHNRADEEFHQLMTMLNRCVLQARMVNDLMYELEEPGDIMSDSRDVAEKLKQVWAALTTGDPRDASSLGDIFK